MMSSSNDSSIPQGWGNRHNTMSEKDLKLGGMAATKFASRQSGAYDGVAAGVYQNSDQVRQHYLRQQEMHGGSCTDSSAVKKELPVGWEDRQRQRDMEQQIMADRDASDARVSANVDVSTEVQDSTLALVRLSTQTLETLALTLSSVRQQGSQTQIPTADRAAFAEAVQKALQILAQTK